MKEVTFTMAGQELHLVFNGAAMFAFEDAFGGSTAYLEKLGLAGRESLEATCAGAAILAEQGELARRALGYDRGSIPDKGWLLTCATPAELLLLRQATLNAILVGYGREVEGEEDVDLGLLELAQKKTRD